MLRDILTISLFVLTAPGLALAQSSGTIRTPRVEFGVGVAPTDTRFDRAPRLTLAPAITINFGPRNAFEAEVSRDTFVPAGSTDEALDRDVIITQFRFKRSVHEYGGGRVIATIGMSLGREVLTFAPLPRPPGAPTVANELRSITGGPVFGAGVEHTIAPMLRVRAEARLAMGEEMPLLGGLVSAQIPVGRYAMAPRADEAPALPPAHALESLRHGQRVWITTRDGRELDGEWVNATREGVALRQTGALSRIAMSEVARVETTDRLREGLIYGTSIGGLAGLGFGAWAAAWLCEDECPGAVAGMAAIGSAIGVVAGATSDSLRVRRRTVFDPGTAPAASVWLAPVVARRGGGVRGLITW